MAGFAICDGAGTTASATMSAMPGNETLTIRAMTRNDVATVDIIERASYPYPWTIGIFRDCLLSGYRCRVLANKDGLVGYAVMTVAADEAHLLNLCIAPAYRGRGLAGSFLSSLLDEAHASGAEHVFLEVRPDNHAARRLYDSAGFNQIGVRPNYYPTDKGRGDALVLARSLVPPDLTG